VSVSSEAVRDKAMAEQSITEADIVRYIKVKGFLVGTETGLEVDEARQRVAVV